MNKFKAYELSVGGVVLRFYLMMAVVIAAGFSGYWIFALLGLPILISMMIGLKFVRGGEKKLKNNKYFLSKLPKENFQEVA